MPKVTPHENKEHWLLGTMQFINENNFGGAFQTCNIVENCVKNK